jgi:hypothetical protein
MPLAEEHDVLLGMNWLRAYNAVIDCSARLVRLRRGRRTLSLLQFPPDPVQAPDAPVLSAAQARRALRSGAEAYLCVIKGPPAEGLDEETWPDQPAVQPGAQDAELAALLDEYKDVFPADLPAGLPPERGEGHTIVLEPGAAPPCKQLYRLSRDEMEELQRQIKNLLAKGFIEPSDSPFGAPLLFVKKEDGGFRMVLDYRALNNTTIKNKYRLPRIEDLLDRVAGHQWFSGLDLASGYWQIRIKEQDVPKTAFRTQLGLFQWRVLPMGITNAPSTFQRVMNNVFRGLLNEAVLVYLDDLLVIGRTRAEHMANLRAVLQRLREAKLYCRLNKCHFMQQEVDFLGFVVGKDGLKVDPKKVRAVAEWPAPTTVHHLRSFLGLSNYFRRFLVGYAKLIAPLTRLLKKDAPWEWTPECAAAFHQVKHMLVSAPVLRLPDLDKPFVVVCDASNVSLGACLMQDDHPIAFESVKLKPNEMNYHAGEKELLAVVHALRVWRCYLSGARQFTVVTDHNPNTTFDTNTTLSDRQARWVELLSRFNFVWKYIPGRTNVADPLSRRPDVQLMALTRAATRAGAPAPTAEEPPHKNRRGKRRSRDQLQEPAEHERAAAEGPAGRPRRERAGINRFALYPGEDAQWDRLAGSEPDPVVPSPGRQPADGQAESLPGNAQKGALSGKRRARGTPQTVQAPKAKRMRRASASLPQSTQGTAEAAAPTLVERIREGYATDKWFKEYQRLHRPVLDESTQLYLRGTAVIVPDCSGLRADVLRQMHDDPLYGHLGTAKTLAAVQRAYWWPNVSGFVKEYCRACDACLRNKPEQARPAGLLQSLPIPPGPWHSVSTDLIVHLPCTARGKDAIAVFVDRLTKMVHFAATTTELDTMGYAHLFVEHVVRLHGLPSEIISDRGPQFSSQLWKSICGLLKVNTKLSSAYHPQTDGQTERANRVLEEMLRAYVGPLQDDWDLLLPMAEFAVNSAWHESVQETPFYLNFGRHPVTPATHGLPAAKHPAAVELTTRIHSSVERAKRLLQSAQNRQKQFADARRRERSFAVGEKVLLSTKHIRLRTPGTQKLMPLFVGPFTIVKRVGGLAYQLELPTALKRLHNVFHVSLLRPYHTPADRQPVEPMPLLLDEGGDWYEVEDVLQHRITKGRSPRLQYLIKWKGFGADHNEWRSERDLTESAVDSYWERQAEPRPAPRRRAASSAVALSALALYLLREQVLATGTALPPHN